jgi:hypothetical protein
MHGTTHSLQTFLDPVSNTLGDTTSINGPFSLLENYVSFPNCLIKHKPDGHRIVLCKGLLSGHTD